MVDKNMNIEGQSKVRGEMPERLKGADCKSVGLRLRWFESNSLHQMYCSSVFRVRFAGVAQLVEHLPSKQDVASSNLVSRSSVLGLIERSCGSVVEHSLGKGEVGSSILPMSTIVHHMVGVDL